MRARLSFTDEEVARLRQYLLKGGFLLVSDYHGILAQEQFDEEIGRALPRNDFPIVDLNPPDHPLWHTMFQVARSSAAGLDQHVAPHGRRHD